MLVNGEKPTINVNDSFNNYYNKDNDNDYKRLRKSKLCSDKEAESGAERYIKLLNAPECRLFFLKVMYHLPYDTRERILESAKRKEVEHPKRFFTYCAKRELAKLGF